MPEATATFEVRREGPAAIVDIRGDVTAGSEEVLMSAYDETGDARAIMRAVLPEDVGIRKAATCRSRASEIAAKLMASGMLFLRPAY